MARKNDILSIYTKEVEQIKADGLFKGEAPFVSPQGAKVVMEDGRELLNMCANNYLGLGDNQRLIDAAKRTYDEKGYGVASVRFICGTQDIHKKLEKKISGFLGTDDTILYSSCFDANGGLFETILTAEDAVISDELNHASIIDGVRLCKAKRYRYKNNNMEDLEAQLQAADAAGARVKLIATDGVFSMDGIICNLKGVCDLADKYNALVMVDDSHAVGFVGAHGRGTSEYCGVEGRVDIITGTLVGQQLTSTGVSEDGQWVEVSINDQTGYVNAQYVSTEAPAEKRSSICFVREVVRTCSPTLLHRQSQEQVLRCSICWKKAPSFVTIWKK